MRGLSVSAFLLALVACATPAQKASSPSVTICMPCGNPCIFPCEPRAAAKPAAKPPPPAPTAASRFDPPPGYYSEAQLVTLSSPTPGAVIHYTTDGSAPTADSPVYTEPIRLEGNTTLKAIAIAPGQPESEVSSAEYAVTVPAPAPEAAPEPPPPPPPPPEPARVVVTKEKLELSEKVFFDTGKTTIAPASFGLLDEVAAVLRDHPEVAKVVVEGHTDNRGGAAQNRELSLGRAEAVRRYLVERGVEPGRVEAKGFGASRPVADNRTAEGREQNRRVEFTIPPE